MSHNFDVFIVIFFYLNISAGLITWHKGEDYMSRTVSLFDKQTKYCDYQTSDLKKNNLMNILMVLEQKDWLPNGMFEEI